MVVVNTNTSLSVNHHTTGPPSPVNDVGVDVSDLYKLLTLVKSATSELPVEDESPGCEIEYWFKEERL